MSEDEEATKDKGKAPKGKGRGKEPKGQNKGDKVRDLSQFMQVICLMSSCSVKYFMCIVLKWENLKGVSVHFCWTPVSSSLLSCSATCALHRACVLVSTFQEI
jgi:hypothetical protein